MRCLVSSPAIVMALALAGSAHAEVVATTPLGFSVRESTEVRATPDEAWAQLIRPAEWWSASHTFSGDPANLSLDAMAAGCFCEVLPSAVSPQAAPRGSVMHMMVVYAEQGRALRMTGALGPMQSEGLHGALTITLKPLGGGGTRIGWEYVVGGYMRFAPEQIAPMVDRVLGEQATRLAARLGPLAATSAAPAKPDAESAPAPKPMKRETGETGR
jgi:hypothetical protein